MWEPKKLSWSEVKAWNDRKRTETNGNTDCLTIIQHQYHSHVFICSYHGLLSPRNTGYLHTSLCQATALCICMCSVPHALVPDRPYVAHVCTMHCLSEQHLYKVM